MTLNRYIGLNRRMISRLHYDVWVGFWSGLELKSHGEGNVEKGVAWVNEDESRAQALCQLMQRVWSYHWLIRVLYWVFNIEHYRTSTYLFHGYLSLKLYEDTKEMRAVDSEWPEETSNCYGFITEQVTPTLMRLFPLGIPALLQSQSQWFCEQVQGLLEGSEGITEIIFPLAGYESEREEEEVSEARVIIQEHMCSFLRPLGLTKSVGETLTRSELRRAYLLRVKETHPDKNRGEACGNVAFIAVSYWPILLIS